MKISVSVTIIKSGFAWREDWQHISIFTAALISKQHAHSLACMGPAAHTPLLFLGQRYKRFTLFISKKTAPEDAAKLP
jgi:hypothetical protein